MKLLKVSTMASLVVSAAFLMTGCAVAGSPEATPAPGLPAAAPSVSETPTPASSSIAPETSEEILEITSGTKKISVMFSGSVRVNDETREIPRHLTSQVKEAIRDSKLQSLPKLSESAGTCENDLTITVPAWDTATDYQLCDYPEIIDDPLFHTVIQILEEVS